MNAIHAAQLSGGRMLGVVGLGVVGLGDTACWSFEAVNHPGQSLRQEVFRLVPTARNGAAPVFNAEAPFCQRAPLGAQAGALSLEPFSAPARFSRHRNVELPLDANDGTTLFPADSSFRVLPPLP